MVVVVDLLSGVLANPVANLFVQNDLLDVGFPSERFDKHTEAANEKPWAFKVQRQKIIISARWMEKTKPNELGRVAT